MAHRRFRSTTVSPSSLRASSTRVAIGLGFYGVASYVFLAVTARALGPASYADFAVFWGILYGIGIGVFLPFEQEVSRRVAETRLETNDAAPILRSALRLGAVFVLALAVVLAIAIPFLNPGGYGDGVALWCVCVSGFLALGTAYITRGAMAGQRRFDRYAVQFGVEGAARLLGCLALLILAVKSPWPYALVVSGAIFLALAVAGRPMRSTATKSTPQPVDLMKALTAVIISSVVAQSLVNFGPVVVRLLSEPSDQAVAGRFMAAALIARAPLLLFAAVQAVLIPHLVEAVVRRDRAGFTSSLRRVLLSTVCLALFGVAICAAAGPELLRSLIGPDFELPRLDVVLLAIAMGLYLVTLVLQPAAISLRRHRSAAVLWLGAGLVFVVACLAPLSPVRAVELALIGSFATAVLGLVSIIACAVPRSFVTR